MVGYRVVLSAGLSLFMRHCLKEHDNSSTFLSDIFDVPLNFDVLSTYFTVKPILKSTRTPPIRVDCIHEVF